MTVSLDKAYVATCLQILGSLEGLVAKAEAHCQAAGLAPEAVTESRLAPDMWPFAKQILEAGRYSAGAIAGVRAGVFEPDLGSAPSDFASLKQGLATAIAALHAVVPGELDAIAERDMRFQFRQDRMDFTVADFLLSLSLPNFLFHATTAYAILRSQGLEIGKRDFMGNVRIKT